MPWLKDGFWNPHSAHVGGRRAAAAVELARAEIAALLPDGGRFLFTSGATEALNLALIGAMRKMPKERNHIVTIASEHSAVLDTCMWLVRHGHDLTILPVDEAGLIDLDELDQAVDHRTALVAVMLVNNEIGVIQPVDAVADIARASGALFLCDAVQGYGRVSLPDADMIALSAHKIHGPKGIGGLWLKDGVAIEPMIYGGGQEQGLRSGTLSPALCAGFGAAARLMAERRDADAAHVAMLWQQAMAHFADWTVNGAQEPRYRGNLNIRREGLDVARLMSDVRGVAFSAGSACASGSGRASHVLRAIGLSEAAAKTSVRLGFGRYTTLDEIDEAAALLRAAAEQQQ